jgi:sialic acid synthase SpsE
MSLFGPFANERSTYIVAELSANHNQSFDNALRLIQLAKNAGADAIKLQTYTADTITMKSSQPRFQVRGGTLWDGRILYDLYQDAYTPWEWQPKLKKAANDLGMDLFSSAFDASAVDFLEQMGFRRYRPTRSYKRGTRSPRRCECTGSQG